METDNLGGYSIEVAKEILEVVRAIQASGILKTLSPQNPRKGTVRTAETPVYFRNDSDAEAPPYACMQVIGTVEDGEQNYCMIAKPADTDASKGEYIFNGHFAVAIDKFGTSQPGRLVRGIKASGTATAGENWQPVVDAWTIAMKDGGRFVMAGNDDIATDVARVFIGEGGGSSGKIQFTVDSAVIASSSSPYNGNMILTVTVIVAPCDQSSLITTSIEVVDWSTCLANSETTTAVVGRQGWAFRGIAHSLKAGDPAGTLTPCHWVLDGLCCP